MINLNFQRLKHINITKHFICAALAILMVSYGCNNTAPQENVNPVDHSTSTNIPSPNIGASEPVDSLRYCLTQDNIGVAGYDLVNYFTNDSAELGSSDYISKYDGVVYQFKNHENKKIFDTEPLKYLPAYGGWCSMTLAMGRATQPTYDNYKIINGQLHLFEQTLSINGKTLWEIDPTENAKLAQNNYVQYIENGSIKTSN